jgi:hypothetical protein
MYRPAAPVAGTAATTMLVVAGCVAGVVWVVVAVECELLHAAADTATADTAAAAKSLRTGGRRLPAIIRGRSFISRFSSLNMRNCRRAAVRVAHTGNIRYGVIFPL